MRMRMGVSKENRDVGEDGVLGTLSPLEFVLLFFDQFVL